MLGFFTRVIRRVLTLGKPLAWTNWAPVIVKRLDLYSGMAVLDAGCGTGRLAIPVAKQVGDTGEVVAVDLHERALRRARGKSRRTGQSNIEFIRSGITDCSLAHDHFDRALLTTVLGDTLERTAVLKSIFDALKPGGILSVTEIVFDTHFQTRGTVARLAELAGFRLTASFGTPIAYTLHFAKPAAAAQPASRTALTALRPGAAPRGRRVLSSDPGTAHAPADTAEVSDMRRHRHDHPERERETQRAAGVRSQAN